MVAHTVILITVEKAEARELPQVQGQSGLSSETLANADDAFSFPVCLGCWGLRERVRVQPPAVPAECLGGGTDSILLLATSCALEPEDVMILTL